MKLQADIYQEQNLTEVVITVPAAFTIAQKNATLKAAKLAGWKYVKLLPEPIAAAFAYFVDRPISSKSVVVLFDLGGGTLDVCVFKVRGQFLEIISENGDNSLGGRDFDNKLMEYFIKVIENEYGIKNLGNKKYKLMLECQNIKHNLSVRHEDHLDDFGPDECDPISITRQEFEKMSKDLLTNIQNVIDIAVKNSGYKAKQINKVLQVGGGSRMPMVKNLLKDLFPKADHCCAEHPDEVVAIGAAYYAYSLKSKNANCSVI
uniref:Heat shock protein 70 n=1 Tax=Panagrolaimus sp. ES5 TaxID=591445 RepID=A0AC34FJ30_9BILA